MRDVLEALADGECSVAEAEARLAGYATTEAGRFDAARERRRGVPEAILATGKTADEVAELASAAIETTRRAIVTRADEGQADAVRERLATDAPESEWEYDERTGVGVAHAHDFEPAILDATVAVVTAGTSDAGPAGEAATIVAEMGAHVERVDDVGVAGLHRLLAALPALREADVLVVAAGREGALPTVIAGLVDTPVIGLPISTGYGHGGDGEAALLGMIQSCSVLTVVNVDAGFVAGAQAGLIARSIGAGRAGN